MKSTFLYPECKCDLSDMKQRIGRGTADREREEPTHLRLSSAVWWRPMASSKCTSSSCRATASPHASDELCSSRAISSTTGLKVAAVRRSLQSKHEEHSYEEFF